MATDITGIDHTPTAQTQDNESRKFAQNANGKTIVRVEDESLVSLLPGGLLQGIAYDYGSVAYPNSTTEVFTFRTGGSGGSITATVTITYTSAGKSRLSTFEVVTP